MCGMLLVCYITIYNYKYCIKLFEVNFKYMDELVIMI